MQIMVRRAEQRLLAAGFSTVAESPLGVFRSESLLNGASGLSLVCP